MASMLVLGDSILWGQGLEEHQKCTVLLQNAWERAARTKVAHHRYAHSGADIWDDNRSGDLAKLNPLPPPFPAPPHFTPNVLLSVQPCEATAALRDNVGEVPADQPFILRQVFDAARELRGTPPDLVVVDMGINDMTVYDLVLPGKVQQTIIHRARSLRPYVKEVLGEIRRAFGDAKVIVTGYYAIVSRESKLSDVLQFARDLEKLAPFFGIPLRIAYDLRTVTVTEWAFKVAGLGLAARDAAWRDTMHDVLRDAVNSFNDEHGYVAEFVDPDFQPKHAVFAHDSLLWHYERGEPPDPKAAERRRWCDDNRISGFERLVVESASFGHPSPRGAERYAVKLVEAAEKLGLFERARTVFPIGA